MELWDHGEMLVRVAEPTSSGQLHQVYNVDGREGAGGRGTNVSPQVFEISLGHASISSCHFPKF